MTTRSTTRAVTRSTTRGTTSTVSGGPFAPAAPVFTTQPTNQTVDEGANATFTSRASGRPSPTYQWEVNDGGGWDTLGGATNRNLTLAAVTAAMDGYQYRNVATNTEGTDTSDVVTLTVEVDIVFTATPSTETPVAGVDVTWTTNATDFGTPVLYMWDFGDGTIPVTLAEPPHAFHGPGPYTVTIVVTYADASTRTDTQVITLQGNSATADKTNMPFTFGTDTDITSYSLYGMTRTNNATTAPDGTNTAVLLDEGVGVDYHTAGKSVTMVVGDVYTYVNYWKYIDCQYVVNNHRDVGGGVSAYAYVVFDLVNGTAVSSRGGTTGFEILGFSIHEDEDGWFRCSYTFKVGLTTMRHELSLSNTNVMSSYGLPAPYTGTNRTAYFWKSCIASGYDPYDPATYYIGAVEVPAPTYSLSIPNQVARQELLMLDLMETNRSSGSPGDFPAFTGTAKSVPVGAKLKSTANVGYSGSNESGNFHGSFVLGAVCDMFGEWVRFRALPAGTQQLIRIDSGSGTFQSLAIDSTGEVQKLTNGGATAIRAGVIALNTWYWFGLAQAGHNLKFMCKEIGEATEDLATATFSFATSYTVNLGMWNASGNVAPNARISAPTRHRINSILDAAYPTEIIAPQDENHIYLIDPVDGDDANDGVTGAWETVTKVNNMLLAANGIISTPIADVTVDAGDWTSVGGGIYSTPNPNPVAYPFIEIDGEYVRNVKTLAQLSSTLYTQDEDAQYTDGLTIYIKAISNPASDARVYVISYVGSGAHLVIDTSVERFDVAKEGLRLYKNDLKVYPVEGETYVEYLAEVVVAAGDWDVTGGYTGIYETPCAEAGTRVIGDGIYFGPVASLGLLDSAAAGASFLGQAVEGATNATPIIITATDHGMADGTQVTISGVVGNTAANGTFTIGSSTADTFALVASVGNGAYTSGGRITTGKLYIKPYTNPTSDGKVYTYGRVRPLAGPNDTIGCPVVAIATNDLWVRGVKTLHTIVNENGSYVVGDITGFTGKCLIEDVSSVYTDKHWICWTINATDTQILIRNATGDMGSGQLMTDYMSSGSGNVHEWINCIVSKGGVATRSSSGSDASCYYSHGGGSMFDRVTFIDCNLANNPVATEGAAVMLEFLACEFSWHQAIGGTSLLDTCTLHAIPQLTASYTKSIVRNCTIDCGVGFQSIPLPRTLTGIIDIVNNTFDMTLYDGAGTHALWTPGGALDLTFTGNTVTWGTSAPLVSTALFSSMATADIVACDNNTYHETLGRNIAYQFDDGGGAANYLLPGWQGLGYDTSSTED